MFPLIHDIQNMRSPHHISDFSFPSLSLLIHERPYQTSRKTSDPFLKPVFERHTWIFLSLHSWLAGTINNDSIYEPKAMSRGPARSDHLDSSEVLGDNIPQHSCVICTHLGARHGHLDCKAGHTPTTRVDGHIPPIQQPCVHMPAFLVMQRPHVTPTAWKAWSKREEDRRECSVPQTQICSPSLAHFWSIQEKPKSKTSCQMQYCASSCSAPQTHGLSDGTGSSGGTLLLQHQMLHPESLDCTERAQVTSLHSWGSPLTTVQPTEEHESYRDIIKRKTLS